MRSSKLDRGLGATVIVFAIAAWLRWRTAAPAVDVRARAIPAIAAASVELPSDTLDFYAETIAENDPFRLANKPSDVRFDPRVEPGVAPVASPVVSAPRPQLVVRGIVGGPPWQAIVDGIPGQPPGTIVSPGSNFDKFVVRAVSRDTVVVQGADTTWKLTMIRPKP